MGGIFHGAADVIRRMRLCPKCGKKQIVPHEKSRETVQCIACGADVPPRRKRS